MAACAVSLSMGVQCTQGTAIYESNGVDRTISCPIDSFTRISSRAVVLSPAPLTHCRCQHLFPKHEHRFQNTDISASRAWPHGFFPLAQGRHIQEGILHTSISYRYSQEFQSRKIREDPHRQGGEIVVFDVPSSVEGGHRRSRDCM